MPSARIVFTPSGLTGEVDVGTTVLEAARRLGADLDTVCGGRGICGRCQVAPGCGRFAKWGLDVSADALGPPAPVELDYRANRPLGMGHRLGCAATIEGDVVVDIPPSSHVHRQVVRKDLDLSSFALDPHIHLYYVDVPSARLGDTATAAELILLALQQQHPLDVAIQEATIVFDAGSLTMLHAALDGDGCTVAIRPAAGRAARIVAIWPGFVPAAFGVAIDVGSTTIAGHLCNLHTGDVLASAGRMNPQIRFGEDLMSRVSYVMMNPGGAEELTVAVRTAVDELIGVLTGDAGIARDLVLDVVLVGNPIMHHLLLGIDPTPLGGAPFMLAARDGVNASAADLDIELPHGDVYVGPCIAGHVGADTAAAVLAEGPHRSARMQLLVDIGTNAEIVLGDRDRQLATSSPTGPAFEGAQISCGQRATTGAIERVRVDRATLDPLFKVIGVDRWSDDPSFADDVDALGTGVTGVCGSGIIDVIAELFLAGVIGADGTIRGELAARTPRVVPDGRTFSYVLYERHDRSLRITQNDVRAIQLAKAALRAGIDLLIEHAGEPEITDIRLAGAFGARIDPVRAMVLGLIPDCRVARVRSVGNAAGAGAVQALLSRRLRREMEDAVNRIVKIETATEARFQDHFIAAMAVPHATADTPHLADAIDLPAATTAAPSRAPADRLSGDPETAATGRARRRRGAGPRSPGDGAYPQEATG